MEAGDLVVADGRILESFSLQVNELSLIHIYPCVFEYKKKEGEDSEC